MKSNAFTFYHILLRKEVNILFYVNVFDYAGAATSLGLGWLRLNWQMVGEATLALCSVIEGILLMMSATAKSMTVAYILYILFGVIYHTMITVAK
jgi:thiamine transporter 2/3